MAGSRCKRTVAPSSFSTVFANRSSRCRCLNHHLLRPLRRHLRPSRHRLSNPMRAICSNSHASTTHPPSSYAPCRVPTGDLLGEVVDRVRRQSCAVWVSPARSRRWGAGQRTAHWRSESWVCSLRLVANGRVRSAKCGRYCWRLRPSRDRDRWGWNGRRPEKESRRDAFHQRQTATRCHFCYRSSRRRDRGWWCEKQRCCRCPRAGVGESSIGGWETQLALPRS